MPVLYKADGTIEFDTITKATEDAGEITAIVYPAESADTDGHLASAEVIKDMAHAFQKEGGQIDIRHDGKAVGVDRAYCAESFIVQKGDPRFVDWKDYDDNPVDATDAWATVIKIDDPKLRQLYKDDVWNGISMQGTGLLTVEKADETDGLLKKILKALGLTSPTNDEDVDMKKQELEEILKADRKDLVAELAKVIKPEPKKEDGKPGEVKKEDEVKLDLTDPKAVREHAEKLEKEEAAKNFDMTDPKIVRELADKLAKEEATKLEQAEADDSDEVKQLKADLRKAEGRSNAPANDDDEKNESYEDFTKEEVAAIKTGSRMAAFNNEAAGYKV
jgi:hypothetical protein